MRDLRKALAGLGAQTRKPRVLRDVPTIMDIERLLDAPGGAWAATFEERSNEASLALFGVTDGDTRLPEPHPDSFGNDDRYSRYFFTAEAFASYNAALEAWYDWQQVMEGFEGEVREAGSDRYWRRYGFDVTDENGEVLRCLPQFERQMYAAMKGILPGARITLDGSGRRRSQSAEEWGTALAAAAAQFRPSR